MRRLVDQNAARNRRSHGQLRRDPQRNTQLFCTHQKNTRVSHVTPVTRSPPPGRRSETFRTSRTFPITMPVCAVIASSFSPGRLLPATARQSAPSVTCAPGRAKMRALPSENRTARIKPRSRKTSASSRSNFRMTNIRTSLRGGVRFVHLTLTPSLRRGLLPRPQVFAWFARRSSAAQIKNLITTTARSVISQITLC